MVYQIEADRFAYWYLRLNGFLTIENFILHDEHGHGPRTDIDLLGVRFPHRREALKDYQDGENYMKDDPRFADSNRPLVAFVEVTLSRCKINGPWTDPEKGNLPRALQALGVLEPNRESVARVADDLYKNGFCRDRAMDFGIVAIGRFKNEDLTNQLCDVMQIAWDEVASFIFHRFKAFERIKRLHPHWSEDGRMLWEEFKASRDPVEYLSNLELRSTPRGNLPV